MLAFALCLVVLRILIRWTSVHVHIHTHAHINARIFACMHLYAHINGPVLQLLGSCLLWYLFLLQHAANKRFFLRCNGVQKVVLLHLQRAESSDNCGAAGGGWPAPAVHSYG